MLKYIVDKLGSGNIYIALGFISLFILMVGGVLMGVMMLFWNWNLNRFLERYDFELWKKVRSQSLRTRLEASRFIKATDDPNISKFVTKQKKYSKLCFLVCFTIFVLMLSMILIAKLGIGKVN